MTNLSTALWHRRWSDAKRARKSSAQPYELDDLTKLLQNIVQQQDIILDRIDQLESEKGPSENTQP